MPAKKPNLHAVGPGETAAPRKVHTRIANALEGTNRDVLASMRLALAKKLDDGDVSSNAIASAYKELRELDRLIRQLDAATEESRADESDVDDTFDASAI